MMTISEIKQELKKYDRKQLYKEKVIKMQASMREMGIDGIICFKPQNTFYLSGEGYHHRPCDRREGVLSQESGAAVPLQSHQLKKLANIRYSVI